MLQTGPTNRPRTHDNPVPPRGTKELSPVYPLLSVRFPFRARVGYFRSPSGGFSLPAPPRSRYTHLGEAGTCVPLLMTRPARERSARSQLPETPCEHGCHTCMTSMICMTLYLYDLYDKYYKYDKIGRQNP